MARRRHALGLAGRPHLPRRTVRLRLTLVYSGLFLLSGVALLGITYVLVVHATQGVIFKGQNFTVVAGTQRDPSGPQPTVTHTETGGPAPGNVPQLSPELAERLADRQHAAELHQLLLQSGIALAAMAVVSIALGWLVAGRVLRPLRTITAAVREISDTNLHRRLALAGPDDELKELGDTFDALLTRLDASFQAQRRFVANASHELRTPLARQRALGQVALADPDASVDSLRAAHERILAAGAQQERLIGALLTLARGQAGIERRHSFDLAALTTQVLAARRAEAAAREVDLHTVLDPAAATGDPRLAERLVANLIDNALRHNFPEGWIDVRTGTDRGHAVLRVSNTGPEVPADAVEVLFQPFRRLDADRLHHPDGLGLGLSIVHAIAQAHGAALRVRPRAGGGLIAEVSFPAPDRPGAPIGGTGGDPAHRGARPEPTPAGG